MNFMNQIQCSEQAYWQWANYELYAMNIKWIMTERYDWKIMRPCNLTTARYFTCRKAWVHIVSKRFYCESKIASSIVFKGILLYTALFLHWIELKYRIGFAGFRAVDLYNAHPLQRLVRYCINTSLTGLCFYVIKPFGWAPVSIHNRTKHCQVYVPYMYVFFNLGLYSMHGSAKQK